MRLIDLISCLVYNDKMYYFNVLPTKNLGNKLSVLLYSSEELLEVGQVVEILIRNKLNIAVVVNQIKENELDIEKDKIKKIEKTIPIKLQKKQLSFIKIFSQNTFNALNDVWEAMWQPYKLVLKKQWLSLSKLNYSSQNFVESKKNSQEEKNLSTSFKIVDNYTLDYSTQSLLKIQSSLHQKELKNFELFWNEINSINKDDNNFYENTVNIKSTIENNSLHKSNQKLSSITSSLSISEVTLRIMYIIRMKASKIHKEINQYDNTLNKAKKDIKKQILVLFPEKKYLNKIYNEFATTSKFFVDNLEQIGIYKYSGDQIKSSKQTVWSMLDLQENSEQENIQVIFTTRAGLFLPFKNLDTVCLVDEANSMYIQEQNSLYYDTREIAFILSKVFLTDLYFFGTVPSIRLYSFYFKENFDNSLTDSSKVNKTLPKIKITSFDKNSSDFDIFGSQLESILQDKEYEETYFENLSEDLLGY